MRFRTAAGSDPTSWPSTVAVPAVGLRIVESMRSVVVLPAPLAPSRPKISPVRQSKSMPRTARTSPRPSS